MLVLTQRIAPCDTDLTLPLPFEFRQKSRFRTRIPEGEEVGWFLARGQILHDGDCLLAEDGRVVRIIAAPENLLQVECSATHQLICAAYHLGNRHVALQVGANAAGSPWLRLIDDYVLRDMLVQLGAKVEPITAPFQPEAGAYGGGHHHGAEGHGPKIHQFGHFAGADT